MNFYAAPKSCTPTPCAWCSPGYTELQSITDAVNEGAIYRFLTSRGMTNGCSHFARRPLPTRNWATKTSAYHRSRHGQRALAAANERLEMVLNNQQQQIDQEAARANAVRDMLDLVPVPLLGWTPTESSCWPTRRPSAFWATAIAVLGTCPGRAAAALPPMATEPLSTPAQTPQPRTSRPCTGWAPLERQGALLNTTPPRGLMVVLTDHHSPTQPQPDNETPC